MHEPDSGQTTGVDSFHRLAILDRGEPAARMLAAVDGLGHEPGRRDITTVLVHAEASSPWFAREADEVLSVKAAAGARGSADLPALVEALRGADVDLVWPSRRLCPDQVGLVAALEEAGIAVVGPSAQVLRRLLDPASLAEVAEQARLRLADGEPDPARTRRFEVQVLRDGVGTSWVLGPVEATVVRSGVPLVAEVPAVDLPAKARETMLIGARRLLDLVGFVGSGTVCFALDTESGDVVCTGVDPAGRPEHALLQVVTGVDLVAWALRLAAGEELPQTAPDLDGHAIEARVVAQDPEAGFRASGGRIDLLVPPSGAGVHTDQSPREGDVVDAAVEPLVTSVTAWGHDRGEALARARQAVDGTQVVIAGGATNRTALLALLRRPELAAGAVSAGWYDGLVATGAVIPEPDPVAVVAAAVEIYESDLAEVRRSFRASAARGRPQHPERVGTAMNLAYRGGRYRLKVDRISDSAYRVHDGVSIEVVVDRLGEHTRRLTVAGRKHRVIAVTRDDSVRLEVDGAAHTVVREDGVVMRTRTPALVAAVHVEPGQRVSRGEPVAVLESMKMVTTITSEVDGRVTSVAVLPNEQVEPGVPLIRIRPDSAAAGGADESPTGDAEPVSLASLVVDGGVHRGIFDRLRDYLLGYDLDAPSVAALTGQYRALIADLAADDPELLSDEDAFLDLFADIGSLYRPRTEAESVDGAELAELAGQTNTEEYFHAFLTWLDADRAGLPLRYRARLERALARYGVDGLGNRAETGAATLWMFRSFERVPTVAPLVVEILTRRLAVGANFPATVTAALRGRLERLVRATEGRQPEVTDLTRDALFHLFEEPVLDRAIDDAYGEMREHLRTLASTTGEEREQHVQALIGCPYPMRPVLLETWIPLLGQTGAEADGARGGVLETYLRRFYRTRDLKAVETKTVDGVFLGFTRYTYEGHAVHLVVAYSPLADLTRVSRAVATHLTTAAFQEEAIVDLVAWSDAETPDIGHTVETLDELLHDCDFGRPLRRLDVTLTYQRGDAPQRERTHHVTYRSGDDGTLVEDRLYRNLHPMLAKRLELWRLSNFELTRLPSPEDVYVFDGVSKENPKDHRIFALGEVRDLEPYVDEQTGRTSYPRLGRVGLEALAAMRQALGRYPARQRPTANRLVLTVRPVWNVPASQWHDLAKTYEDLSRGAGLSKVVLHVKLPEPQADGSTQVNDRVLHLEGLGAGGLTVRVTEVGPNPVRSLTKYDQKVLTAARFGSPYPYEIARMLTPSPGDSSAFPPGSWQEMDLGPDDVLEPVDREPGNNKAHLVVGTITNVTDAYPEGMTRVAILSDPTQGLGNLAEPECRRINAALAYAMAHKIPLEWYAVSSGALIAMDSGTENMDWISLTLRRIIEYTQAGGHINIIVTGINVGGQPYWNAESTMLMHCKGILIMTPASTMVLTGKQALDFSGAVSADDNFGIGGFDRIMGLNGQGQYWAPSFPEACRLLLDHYELTYVVPGERFPRRRPTTDPYDRDIRPAPHAAVPGSTFTKVGDVFDRATNPERKSPFDMRSIMRAVSDADAQPLERWQHWQDADTIISWNTIVGGYPVAMIGMESRAVPRRGFVPSYGPPQWTSGTLFPQASRKCARTINSASGNVPLVVLANLSGFDGSPESMRNWQLEYGAEIGRAVTNFDGPIVFVVVSRYHGGAFVVFSKRLNESMEIAAVEGSFASVIGGAPAAATVFAREVKIRTEKDSRLVEAREAAKAATGAEAGALRAKASRIAELVRSERLREVADEFDSIHTIERAQRMGSVDRIISADIVRPYVIEALERGIAAYHARKG